MNFSRIGLLPRVIVAILAGFFLGPLLGKPVVQCFATFNSLFGQFIVFCVPLIILGLVVPGIADLGKKSGKLLLFTVLLAYVFTFFSGYYSYLSCCAIFPRLNISGEMEAESESAVDPKEKNESDVESASAVDRVVRDRGIDSVPPYFTLEIPPVLGVISALLLAFILGIGISYSGSEILKTGFLEFRGIVEKLISAAIIPLLPIHVFGLFLNMSHTGTAFEIIGAFGKVIGVIFVLHIILLLLMYVVAGMIRGRNPLKMLCTMLPAYATALGTSSSAATIPITLRQAKLMGIREDIADFCIPLCATIHLSGSMLKIVATALAICMFDAMPHDLGLFSKFIAMLAVMMVAAPGVPGGAIMAATGVLASILGFDSTQLGLMIALYLAIDSFGTATNVTGDGAIAAIIDRFS